MLDWWGKCFCIHIFNSTEQSFTCEANNYSARQEITCISWSLKDHYHVHKGVPLVPILSQICPFHCTLPPCFPKIHSNVIPSTMLQ